MRKTFILFLFLMLFPVTYGQGKRAVLKSFQDDKFDFLFIGDCILKLLGSGKDRLLVEENILCSTSKYLLKSMLH